MEKIAEITHPDYDKFVDEWKKFRFTYKGGHDFVDEYLEAFSVRETDTELQSRKKISYCSAHAKAALMDINNSIAQRMPDVTRSKGTQLYRDAISGEGSGVDRDGNSIDGFMTRKILPELTSMGKVGVYVDRKPLPKNPTKQDTIDNRPYLYRYTAENIRSWAYNGDNELSSLLLRDYVDEPNEETGLVEEEVVRFRHLRLIQVEDTKFVTIQFYDEDSNEYGELMVLDLPRIPFVLFELNQSLLADVADIQVAMTNMASSDIMYGLKANHPFYTEQYDPISELAKGRGSLKTVSGTKDGEATQAHIATDAEVEVGTTKGRRYPINAERPGFIHPSSEPLRVSMEKQDQLKQEIRQLINLSLTNIEPRRASAESKELDQRGLESGLANIGSEAEYGERMIAAIWAEYEDETPDATIKYPTNYSLRSDEDRHAEAKELTDLLPKIPSLEFKKHVAKQIVTTTIGHKIADKQLAAIHKEIDDAEVIVTDREVLTADLEAGLVSVAFASEAVGYPPGQVEQAKKDHAERLARIQESQALKTRGVDDTVAAEGDEDDEKDKTQDSALDDTGKKKTRGEEK